MMKILTDAGGVLDHDPPVAALWAKLRQLSFDGGAGPRTFAARLAGEQGWSAEFTAQAIEEYRRFILLFALEQGRLAGLQPLAGGPPAVRIVPSAAVDKVWHLHLLYTRSYWEALCRDVLGAPLHHLPADGSSDEGAILDQVYRHTLDAYRRTFGQAPPLSIWPPPDSRPASPPVATPGATAVGSDPARLRSTRGWLLVSCPCGALLGLLLAQRATAENITLSVGAGCVLAAAAVLFVAFVTGPDAGTHGGRSGWRRRPIYFSGNGDVGDCGAAGGADSSSGGTDAYHGAGHGGGGHDSGGHSHGCGGHGCGGHSCGGHGCGGH